MTTKVFSIAYFVSHPIQYQAPLLKLLAAQPDIKLHVYYLTDLSNHAYKDQGFNKTINWDTPLLDEYEYTFLKSELVNNNFSLFNPKVKLSSVKQALMSKQWDAVWIHGYNNFALLYILWKTSKIGIPLFFRGESNLYCSPQNSVKDAFIKYLIKRASGLLWVSSDNRDYYRHYGAQEEQLFFTPYAVNNYYFQTHESVIKREGSNNEKCILLFASKFSHRKNAPLLLSAYNNLDPSLKAKSELWFVGDGEDKSILHTNIKKYGLESQVSLLGFKNQSEMPIVLSQCDVFILPSEKEPFGLIINEAMNLGKAIIATNEVGAARDLVKHNENGWIVEAGSIDALEVALTEAIQNRTELNTMGELSLAKINKWSYAENVEGIRQALNSLS